MSPEVTSSRAVHHELFVRSFFSVQPPTPVTRQIAHLIREISVKKGGLLFDKGSPADSLYFVFEGEVALESEGEVSWELREQSIIGIVDAWLARPHLRRARAMTDVQVMVLDFQDYLDILEDNFEFTMIGVQQAFRIIADLTLKLAPDNVFPPPGIEPPLKHRLSASGPLNLVERLMVLSSTSSLKQAPIQALVSLAELATEEQFAAGAIIEPLGAPSVALRFLFGGKAGAEREQPRVSADFGPGDLLGGHTGLAYATTQYRLVARTDCSLLRVQKEDLFDVMEDLFGLTKTLFAFVARENERARHLLAERNLSLE